MQRRGVDLGFRVGVLVRFGRSQLPGRLLEQRGLLLGHLDQQARTEDLLILQPQAALRREVLDVEIVGDPNSAQRIDHPARENCLDQPLIELQGDLRPGTWLVGGIGPGGLGDAEDPQDTAVVGLRRDHAGEDARELLGREDRGGRVGPECGGHAQLLMKT